MRDRLSRNPIGLTGVPGPSEWNKGVHGPKGRRNGCQHHHRVSLIRCGGEREARSPRTRSLGAFWRGGGSRRDGGQMLLLSGVLIVMGFLVMGTTLVQLQGMEGSTERTQRDSLMETARELIAGLNQTIRDSVIVGETNITSFQETLRNAEANLRDNAVRSGVYASVKLAADDLADLEHIFWRDSRCIGYNPQGSEDGVIVGWERTSFQESIAGAVYDIHITDGRQSFRSLVYVKIMDCARIEITSVQTTIGIGHGTVTDPTAMRLPDGIATTLTEELDMDTIVEVMVHPTVIEDTIDVEGWNNPKRLLKLDGDFTGMPSRSSSLPANNWFHFQIDPPERMKPDETLPNITLEVTGYRERDNSLLYPQDLYLNVYPNKSAVGTLAPLVSKKVVLPVGSDASASQTVEIVLEELVALTGEWTYDQIVDSFWELTVFGVHQPSQAYHIDHFNMTGGLMMSQGYRLDVELDWQDIPFQYSDHEVHLKYSLDGQTVDEGFLLLVRDRDGVLGGGDWMEVHNMTDTGGAWLDLTFTTAEAPDGSLHPVPNRLQFRIMDTIITDNWEPEDQDTLQIEHLYVTSRLQGS